MTYENTAHLTALIRLKLTPEIIKTGCDIMQSNLAGILEKRITMEEVVASMLMHVEMQKAGINR